MTYCRHSRSLLGLQHDTYKKAMALTFTVDKLTGLENFTPIDCNMCRNQGITIRIYSVNVCIHFLRPGRRTYTLPCGGLVRGRTVRSATG